MKKTLISVLLMFGLVAGSASAATITLQGFQVKDVGDGIVPSGIPGEETDTYGTSRTLFAGTGNLVIGDGDATTPQYWMGLNILQAVDATITSEAQLASVNNDTSLGGAITPLNLRIYSASVGTAEGTGGVWTYNATALDTALPSPLGPVLLSAGFYLINMYGTLAGSGSDILKYDLDIQVTSVVPVPAAVWLFGTALFGLFGIRRKGKMVTA